MVKVVSLHSFRGGTGKSNITANTAAIIAQAGHRVGVIDTDIQSPGIHTIFQMSQGRIKQTLNDYLWGRCRVQDATYDVTPPELQNSNLAVTVEIQLEADSGDIAGLGIVVPSGEPTFDIAALEALLRAQPTPPPPEALSEDGFAYLWWRLHRDGRYACSPYFARPLNLKQVWHPPPTGTSSNAGSGTESSQPNANGG